MTPSILAWSLATPLALMMAGAGAQPDTADAAPPSALERALTERVCLSLPSAATADADARQRCVDAQLSLLRNDFGRDLRRLSAAERGGLDAGCSRFETTHGRETYLDCVNTQLLALRAKRSGATAGRGATTTAASLPAAAPAQAAADDAPAQASASTTVETDAPAEVNSRTTAAIGAVLLGIAAIAGGSLVVLRRRDARRHCRQCGALIADSGDLCAACRHAAAETLRRAASERMDQVQIEEAERRRQSAETEERRQQALREEEVRQREQQEAQRRAENARRLEEEEARRQNALAMAHASSDRRPEEEEAFDPYAVLGVPRDTPPDQIRAAYEQARTKYDQDTVAHLGVDVQEHFREKAQAVDRAYHMLAG